MESCGRPGDAILKLGGEDPDLVGVSPPGKAPLGVT